MLTNDQNRNSEDENKVDGDLTKGDYPMLNTFFQMYPPAGSIKGSSMTMTTAEIQETIGRHSGSWFETTQLYNWLTHRGYKQDTLGEAEFVWLINKQED